MLPRLIPIMICAALASCGAGNHASNQANGGTAVQNSTLTKLSLTREAFKDGPEFPVYHNISDIGAQYRNRLTSAVLGLPEMNNLFLETLLDCAKSITEPLAATPGTPADARGWMEREIEKEYAQIKAGVYSDPETQFTSEQFEAEVNSLRNFAKKRGDFVRAQVAAARQP